MRPFISRYPRYLAASSEFCDLQSALEPELLALWDVRDSALEQLCVETATWGLSFWERTLGLPVDDSGSWKTRRGMVRSRLMGAGVATVASVQRIAELYSGVPVTVEEHPNEFRVDLLFDDGGFAHQNLDGLVAELRELMPAHLYWTFQFYDGFAAALYTRAVCTGIGTVDGAWALRY